MIRQKTYDIFIRPYTIVDQGAEDKGIAVHKGSVLINSKSGQITAQGGECWMLYKGNITSLSIAQKEIKKLMDTLGVTRENIKLSEVIPLDYVITPLR